MNSLKKALAIFMTVLMIVSMMNVGASAATYTARIEAGSGEGSTLKDGITADMLSLTTNSNNRVTLPDEAYFERENYIQDGWTTTQSGGGTLLKFGSVQLVRNNRTKFYPHWQQLVFTVTFEAGSNYDETDVRNYTDSTMATVLSATTKTDGTSEQPVVFPDAMFYRVGYTQTGWSIASNNNGAGTKYEFGSTYDGTVTKDRAFYPYWTINTYTVTYLPGQHGMGTETSVSVGYNKKVTLEGAIFTREGYTQTGWSLVDGGDMVYDLGATITMGTEDIVLYPYWIENECGSNLTHTWENGICSVCGIVCGTDVEHSWENGICTICNAVCGTDVEHTWKNGICTICGVVCGTDTEHTFENCVCKVCGIICGTDMEHIWEKGSCSICGLTCEHNYENGICSVCGDYEPAILVTSGNYETLNLTESYLGYYAIGNLGQLSWFRDFVNSNIQLSGVDTEDDITDDVYSTSVNGVLINDIDMNPEYIIDYSGKITGTPGIYDKNGVAVEGSFDLIHWNKGIGSSSTVAYTGMFDGNSFLIKDVYIIDTGLFHYNNGIIKNLNILSGQVVSGNYYAGSICSVNMGSISNCTSDILCVGFDEGGGICGYNKGGIISECVSYGLILYGAGICGKNDGKIINCTNYGDNIEVNSEDSVVVAGICNRNYGTITHSRNMADFLESQGASGICAYNGGNIEFCYNVGNIKAEDTASGICAESGAGTIKNCYNTGTITGGDCYVGAICGASIDTTIENCYYLKGCATDGDGVVQNGIGNETLGMVTEDVEGSTMAKIAEEFASGEVCYLLNGGVTDGTQAFYQNIDNGEEVDSTPVFSGGTVYKVGPCTGVKTYTNIEADVVCEHIWGNDVCSTCGLSMLKSVSDKTKIDHTGKSIFTKLLLCKSLDEIVTVIEGYTTRLTASFGDYIGTGSIVEVLDSDANTVSTYTVVVENDVNGDSVCDVLDCAQVARVTSGYDSFDGAYKLAADSDNNGEIDINDYQAIVNAALQ